MKGLLGVAVIARSVSSRHPPTFFFGGRADRRRGFVSWGGRQGERNQLMIFITGRGGNEKRREETRLGSLGRTGAPPPQEEVGVGVK